MTTLYLCIDAGGTKVSCAISDERGEIVSRGSAGSGNMAEVWNDLRNTTRSAILHLPPGTKKSGSPQDEADQPVSEGCPVAFGKVWIGLAGCDTPKDSRGMTRRLEEFFIRSPVLVTNDALLLSSPLVRNHSPWGIAVVAGTGSVVVGIRRDERDGSVTQIVRRGGQGHLVNGDPGSAYNLGLTAAKLAADDADFGLEREGGLAGKVREYWGVGATADVPSKLAILDPTVDPVTASNLRKLRIAAFAPQVMDSFLAEPPDPLAVRVVRHCARLLAADIAEVANKAIQLGHGNLSVATLSVTGGAIAQEEYREVILEELKGMGMVFGFVDHVVDTAGEGAMAMAMAGR